MTLARDRAAVGEMDFTTVAVTLSAYMPEGATRALPLQPQPPLGLVLPPPMRGRDEVQWPALGGDALPLLRLLPHRNVGPFQSNQRICSD
jgi:hypothetical protein